MRPDAAQPAAISVQVARKTGAGLEAADLGLRARSARGLRILEPGALNSLEFFSAGKLYLDRVPVMRPGGCRGTHIAVIARGIIAAGNRGNRQLALAWDDSLVTPLRSLGRLENAGARPSVLGFW
jgi:hypothetical protein